MIIALLSFVGGAWLFQYQPRVPDPALFAVYVPLLLLAIPLRWLRLPACLVCGFAWAHGHAVLTGPAMLPVAALDGPVRVAGTVSSLVVREPGRARFVLRVDQIGADGDLRGGPWPLRVTWYRDPPQLRPGERWRLTLRIRRPAGYHNPGGFDYTRWLYQQGIAYTASVRNRGDNHRVAPGRGWSLARLRQHLADGMGSGVADHRSAALLRALVIGDRSGFDRDDWRVFTATGTNHLVAISGLHVGLVAGLAALLGAGLWRRVPPWCARWPAMYAGAVAALFAATGYAALAGFSIPTQRAVLMLGVAGLAWCAGRGRQPGLVLALALAAVVAWQPVAVLSPGLWLSFAAVAAILWVMLPGGRGRLWRWIGLQAALGLALLPLLLLLFGQASLSAPLVNLLAVPWFSVVMVPLALIASLCWLAVPSLGQWLWQAWAWLGRGTLDALGAMAEPDWTLLSHPVVSPALVVLALGGVALLLAPRGMPGRWLGLVLLVPLLTREPRPLPDGGFELVMLDVGQGLAVAVSTRRHVLLYDAGPRFRSGFDTGSAVVLPYLKARGIDHVDTLVASHSDVDHAGGVATVRQALPVRRLLSGEPRTLAGAEPCAAGQHWSWDGVDFRVLSPPAGHRASGNNASCVIMIGNGHRSILLTGDIEAPVEQQLLDSVGLDPVDVVVVPHHGSLSSSTPEFVARLRPRIVLYATGPDNRWGFPKPAVVTRWRDAGALAWDSARDGGVRVVFGAGEATPVVSGAKRHHYWQP